jgi:hypothetical protein
VKLGIEQEWNLVVLEAGKTERERETFIFITEAGEGRTRSLSSGKLREAKATTLRRVRLACSCAMGGTDVVGEVKGVDELGVGVCFIGIHTL